MLQAYTFNGPYACFTCIIIILLHLQTVGKHQKNNAPASIVAVCVTHPLHVQKTTQARFGFIALLSITGRSHL